MKFIIEVTSWLALLIALLPLGHGVVLRGAPEQKNASKLAATNTSASVAFSVSNSSATFTYDVSQISKQKKGTANRPPRIFFLFLAVDKISNFQAWKNFFATADPNLYRAFVHCKLPQCLQFVQGSFMIPVPTVPSYYCTDLVSPMNQLLGHALNNDPGFENPSDKFVFVSDSTLPAKPFSEVYRTLSMRQGSDFCAFPAGEWADIPGAQGGIELAVKVHQWMVLERAHAINSCVLWASGKNHDLMQRFYMNYNSFTYNNNTYADHRNFGCLDEFWHMATLFGTLSHTDATRDAVVSLQMFTGSPLRITASAGWQGACDTMVIWSKYLHAPGANPFSQLHTSLDPPSIPHGGNDQRPGWWDTISTTGMQAIRNSGFLFVRKFVDGPRLADGNDFTEAYTRIVLQA